VSVGGGSDVGNLSHQLLVETPIKLSDSNLLNDEVPINVFFQAQVRTTRNVDMLPGTVSNSNINIQYSPYDVVSDLGNHIVVIAVFLNFVYCVKRF